MRGARANSAAVRMNSRRVSIAEAYPSQSDFSQANYLAFGDTFVGQSRSQVAQIIVIKKSRHAPGTHKVNKSASRCPPDKWFAVSAQPPINQFTLRIETNPAVTLFLHECEYKPATGRAQTFQCSHQ